MKIGIGFDVHKFSINRKLILGGIHIPYEFGLAGHSDADVLIHSICDAILGALGLGDIGNHFPDTDLAYKDANSLMLLQKVVDLMKSKGYKIINIDAVIMAEAPKIQPHTLEMKRVLSNTLTINPTDINIKATTMEQLGFVGRKEGIAAQAVVLIE